MLLMGWEWRDEREWLPVLIIFWLEVTRCWHCCRFVLFLWWGRVVLMSIFVLFMLFSGAWCCFWSLGVTMLRGGGRFVWEVGRKDMFRYLGCRWWRCWLYLFWGRDRCCWWFWWFRLGRGGYLSIWIHLYCARAGRIGSDWRSGGTVCVWAELRCWLWWCLTIYRGGRWRGEGLYIVSSLLLCYRIVLYSNLTIICYFRI